MRRWASSFVLVLACATLSSRAFAQSLSTPGPGTWWRAAPTWHDPAPSFGRSIEWRNADGIEWAETEIIAARGLVRTHAVLVRFNPRMLKPAIEHLVDASGVRGAWLVDSAGPDIVLALNAGQFEETGPWGWLVSQGRELQPPEGGPLSAAVIIDRTGNLRIVSQDSIERLRRDMGDIDVAFQSYPRIIANGRVPGPVQSGRGMDAKHRDARLALGLDRSGRVILALTRFGTTESAASRIPIGLTTQETAALMRALSAVDAVMLDGGLSAQLLLRPPDSGLHLWRGARKVPIGLVFRRR